MSHILLGISNHLQNQIYLTLWLMDYNEYDMDNLYIPTQMNEKTQQNNKRDIESHAVQDIYEFCSLWCTSNIITQYNQRGDIQCIPDKTKLEFKEIFCYYNNKFA